MVLRHLFSCKLKRWITFNVRQWWNFYSYNLVPKRQQNTFWTPTIRISHSDGNILEYTKSIKIQLNATFSGVNTLMEILHIWVSLYYYIVSIILAIKVIQTIGKLHVKYKLIYFFLFSLIIHRTKNVIYSSFIVHGLGLNITLHII